MIDLMQECSRQKLFSFYDELFHIFIIGFYLCIIRSCHNTCLARYGKTAFLSGLLTGCFKHLRIDQK